MITAKWLALLAILLIVFQSCDSGDLVSSNEQNQNDEVLARELKRTLDSLVLTPSKTMKDFRENAHLNPRITVTDIPGSNGEGRTIVKCDDTEIFNNTWNVPTYGHDRMMTVVEHGFSTDGSQYFLRVYNQSVIGQTYFSEYKLFTIRNNGPIIDIRSNFKFFLFEIQEYRPGQYIVYHTDGWIRNPMPEYYSILFSDGSVQHQFIPLD